VHSCALIDGIVSLQQGSADASPPLVITDEIARPEIENPGPMRREIRIDQPQKHCAKTRPIDRFLARGEARFLNSKCSSASFQSGARNAKSPTSEEAGLMIRQGQSPLRRDQIRVKPSSPSTFTSEA
jgi:hypothetical protein